MKERGYRVKKPKSLLQATRRESYQYNAKLFNYWDNQIYTPNWAHSDCVADMLARETLDMERVGQVVARIEETGTKYLIILYRPLDKGKSREIWHLVGIQHLKHQNDRWYAAEGWCYGWYERERNKTDRRQLLLF